MKLCDDTYTNIIDAICNDPNIPELIKAVLKSNSALIQDLVHEKFMLECEILDVDDALQGKSLDWNSRKSAERCEKILKLLGDNK